MTEIGLALLFFWAKFGLRLHDKVKKLKELLHPAVFADVVDSPMTISCIFLLRMPGAFFTLHWYVPESDDLRPVRMMAASPFLGSAELKWTRPFMGS